jgi:hypothetical protein
MTADDARGDSTDQASAWIFAAERAAIEASRAQRAERLARRSAGEHDGAAADPQGSSSSRSARPDAAGVPSPRGT